jgi:hypothetical protein
MESNHLFFAPLDYNTLQKSVNKDGDIDVKINGIISTDSKDYDGDEMIQDRLDFSIFEKSGRVKYEHHKDLDPKFNIGMTLGTVRLGKRTDFVGHIFAKAGTPQHDIAKAALGDMENMKAWTLAHPDNPRIMGFSIEGGMVKDKKTGKMLKGIVTDVVLTGKPKNAETYANFYKSFEAGSAVDLPDMTGSQAGRKQHLDGAKNLIGAHKMKFANKKECKEFYMEKGGLPEDEAEAKATEWESYNKSIGDLGTAMELVEEFVDRCAGTNYQKIQKSFADSWQPDETTNEVDAVPFFKAIGNALLDLNEKTNDNAINIANMLGAQFGFTKSLFDSNYEMIQKVEGLIAMNKSLIEDNEDLREKLESIDKGVTTNNLDNLNIEGTDKNTGSDPTGKEIYSPAEVFGAFRKSMAAAQTDKPALFSALNAEKVKYDLSEKKFEVINKSIVAEIQQYLPTK